MKLGFKDSTESEKYIKIKTRSGVFVTMFIFLEKKLM